MTFNALRLLDNTGFATAQSASNWTMEWAGNYDIHTTKSGSVYFYNGGMAGAIVSANLSGDGRIFARGIGSASYDCHLTMSGNNVGYTGTFAVTNQTTNATYRCFILKAASESNFGGNPKSFAADAWRLGTRVAFTPTAAITMDDENRGVTIEGGSVIDTAENCDFTVRTPVVVEGGFTKRGTGLFAYGAGGFTPPNGAWTVSVEGGVLKPQHANALKGATVVFATGATLALDALPPAGWGETGLDLTTAALAPESGQLKIRFDCTGVAVATVLPVATLASEEAARMALSLLTVERTKGYRLSLKAEGATLYATIEKSGFAVLVR